MSSVWITKKWKRKEFTGRDLLDVKSIYENLFTKIDFWEQYCWKKTQEVFFICYGGRNFAPEDETHIIFLTEFTSSVCSLISLFYLFAMQIIYNKSDSFMVINFYLFIYNFLLQG